MEIRINKTKIKIIKDDVTKVRADVLVNWTVPKLNGGNDTFFKIHKEGGSAIYQDCQRIIASLSQDRESAILPVALSAMTTAGALPARTLIHGVVPDYRNEQENKEKKILLSKLFGNIFSRIYHYNEDVEKVNVVAFYPIPELLYGEKNQEEAAEVTIDRIIDFTEKFRIRMILVVCENDEDWNLYKDVLYNRTTTKFERFTNKILEFFIK